jgi:hypothetical protein
MSKITNNLGNSAKLTESYRSGLVLPNQLAHLQPT